ncbi:DUF3010 family protein [Xanthomonas translucens pv. graminis]|uniref:DUF3010 family protein n=1 Tax=Xanthomonas graminis TaxID=3390026 RepID=UPI0025406F6C|nr:DUF3010 family protein [Xanthomonas translucens]WIH04638.1 DUF3010 family protein [Xanthomonas translucens pv. graminis]
MSICGVTIASNEATFVWADPNTGVFVSGVKISLNDPYSRADTQRTMELIRQYLIDRQTEIVVVKKASTSGRFSAAPAAFKLETIIALASPGEVVFKSAQTVSAFSKKVKIDSSSVPHKYQRDAHLTALSGVM